MKWDIVDWQAFFAAIILGALLALGMFGHWTLR